MASWYKHKDTLAQAGHVIAQSRDKATGSYCSALEKGWSESWNKYTKQHRTQHSQLRKVKAVTPPQVIIEPKSLENTSKFKQKHKFQSKLKGFKKRKRFSRFQVTILV